MREIHSYPSIYNLGHPAVAAIFSSPVVVQEKVDGSQFSFCKNAWEDTLHFRSKRADVHPEDPGMFKLACTQVKARADLIPPGVIFRGEYLQKPKHNTLSYDNVPDGNIVLFDIETSPSNFLGPEGIALWAEKLGFSAMPLLYYGLVEDLDHFTRLLDRGSFLGGTKVEGVVAKNYSLFGPDKKALMAKHVSEKFKEIHQNSWKIRHPGKKDIVEEIKESLRTEARWEKAIQHLKEDGREPLTHSPKDIGRILGEIKADLNKEAKEIVAAALFKHFWPEIQRGAAKGFPEWYKEKLLEEQFSEGTD